MFSFVPPRNYAGGWAHYVFVFARSAGIVQCYMNGSLVGSSVLSDNGGDLGHSPIEAIATSGGSTLLLNEVSIWGRALGAAEIASVYSGGVSGMGVVDLSRGFQRNPNPAEPFSIVHYTMQDLQLMSSVVASPIPTPILTMSASTKTNLEIQVYGVPGWNYTVQASSNLTSWTPFLTNVQEAVPASISKITSGNRFFRASSQ